MSDKSAIANAALLAMATARANADPLPGPLAKAFGPSTIMVGGISVRKPVASDWEIFRQLDSPIIRILLELRQDPSKVPEIEPTQQENWEICWQFTHSPKECRAALTVGNGYFRQLAASEIGDVWDEPTVMVVRAVIMNKIAEANATAIKYAADLEEKGEVTFFRDSGATRTTDSAGGLSTSPDSAENTNGAMNSS